jgi:hypothetical protein
LLRRFFHRILDSAARRTGLDALAQIAIDQELRQIRAEVAARTPLNPMLHGFKVYSQIDEDGIIERLFDAIGTRSRIFVEVGSGSGLENNTHYLVHKGWRGMWIEGDAPQVQQLRALFPSGNASAQGRGADDVDLCVYQGYIAPDTIDRVLASGMAALGRAPSEREIDFLSMDIDGDDLAVLEAIQAVRPRVICAEYNPRFRPPVSLEVSRRRDASWTGDDYYGGSLQAFVDLLGKRGYVLICCNASGNNAFFVASGELASGALPVHETAELYQEARYHLVRKRAGHAPSLAYLARKRVIFLPG